MFVLKGAALFTLWTGHPHRATRDVDLLGFGDSSEARVREIIAEVIAPHVEDDGVVFDAKSLKVGPIREDKRYGGTRAILKAHISTAKVRLQVDIGFGDAIISEAQQVVFPALLDFPPPKLLAYPRESVVAEKLEAMVQLDIANSRMKDFYDVVVLARRFEFEGELLVRAIRATFERRETLFPDKTPSALTATFSADTSKNSQWRAFIRKAGINDAGDLPSTIARIVEFLAEPLAAAAQSANWNKRWLRGGPWV